MQWKVNRHDFYEREEGLKHQKRGRGFAWSIGILPLNLFALQQ